MSGQRPTDTQRFVRTDRLSSASARPVTETNFDQMDALQEHKARRLPSLSPTKTQTSPKESGTTQRDELLRAVDRAISNSEEPVWGRDGELPILFNKLPTSPVFPTSPVWSPAQSEEVVVMQQSQREAWKCLGRRFSAAHDEDATSPERGMWRESNARAAAGRRSSMSHPLPRQASDPLPAKRAQGRRASLPDQRQLAPRSPASPLRSPVLQLRSPTQRPPTSATQRPPTAAVVRGQSQRPPTSAVVRGQSRGPPLERPRGPPLGSASTPSTRFAREATTPARPAALGPRHMFSRQMRRVA